MTIFTARDHVPVLFNMRCGKMAKMTALFSINCLRIETRAGVFIKRLIN
jgi:hypothetical protein